MRRNWHDNNSNECQAETDKTITYCSSGEKVTRRLQEKLTRQTAGKNGNVSTDFELCTSNIYRVIVATRVMHVESMLDNTTRGIEPVSSTVNKIILGGQGVRDTFP